jgi:mannose-6-phosphate isomerase
MTIIEKSWGYERILEQNEHYVVKLLHLNPNSRTSLQYHKKKHETLILISGISYLTHSRYAPLNWMMWNDGGIQEPNYLMITGEPVVLGPTMYHRLGTDESSADLIEISTPELDDVVRLEDDYGRA